MGMLCVRSGRKVGDFVMEDFVNPVFGLDVDDGERLDYESLLICSVRYCLGRRSYIVGFICGKVLREWAFLSSNCRSVILGDVKREIGGLDSYSFRESWQDLLDKCDRG